MAPRPDAKRASGASTKRAAPKPAPAAAPADDGQLRDVLAALDALRDGDFSVRLSTRKNGVAGEVARAFNAVAERNAKLHRELTRVAKVVGREGRMDERVEVAGLGAWVDAVAARDGRPA